jgi:hypothetical protein
MIEDGAAGHRPMGVAAHAIGNHQAAAILGNGHGDWSGHVSNQNLSIECDAILIGRANPATVGKGGGMPNRHRQSLGLKKLEEGGLVGHIVGGGRHCRAQ